MELQHYLNVLKRRWWVPALLVILSLSTVVVYTTYFVTPVYEASADLIVNKTVEAESGQQQIDQNSINTNLMLINTYKEIIKSPAVLNQVIARNPELNLTTSELSQKITIDSMKDTQIISVKVEDGSYPVAAKVVGDVSNIFQDRVTNIMKVNNVSVLNEANPELTPGPVNDNHMVLLLFSGLVALLVGMGIIFLLDYLDHSVKNENDIEQLLGLTLLAKIPVVKRNSKVTAPSNVSVAADKAQVLQPLKQNR